MRVISGSARGLKLESLAGSDTRPTLDRVKEAVFSMLYNKCAGANVLDLFAGSGALGIECLSRGAKMCTFADNNAAAIGVIQKNLQKTRMSGKAYVVKADCNAFLAQHSNKSYNLIFLDPPYATGKTGEVTAILQLIYNGGMLSGGGYIVLECDKNFSPDIPDCFNVVKNKTYGRVHILILEA